MIDGRQMCMHAKRVLSSLAALREGNLVLAHPTEVKHLETFYREPTISARGSRKRCWGTLVMQ